MAPPCAPSGSRLPKLAAAYLVNELGNWLGEIALAILVFDQTGSPVATAGAVRRDALRPGVLDAAAGRPARRSCHARALPLLYASEAAAFARWPCSRRGVRARGRPGARGARRLAGVARRARRPEPPRRRS